MPCFRHIVAVRLCVDYTFAQPIRSAKIRPVNQKLEGMCIPSAFASVPERLCSVARDRRQSESGNNRDRDKTLRTGGR